MIISPIMKFIVDKEAGFPAPSEKDKLNQAISKFRKILKNISGTYNIAETKFGLADMLVGRGDPSDYKEAMNLYNDILSVAPTSYLRARALIGKAELLIPSPKSEDINEALALTEKADKILRGDLSDFFGAKGIVVASELLAKKGEYKKAAVYFERVLRAAIVPNYFKARASVGRSELFLYKRELKGIDKAIKLCNEAVKLLKERPDDYFAQKAAVVEAELRLKRSRRDDLKRASNLLSGIIKNPNAYKELIARAKLDLAMIVAHPKAMKLYKEVIEMEGLDPYLIEKARQIERYLREKAIRK